MRYNIECTNPIVEFVHKEEQGIRKWGDKSKYKITTRVIKFDLLRVTLNSEIIYLPWINRIYNQILVTLRVKDNYLDSNNIISGLGYIPSFNIETTLLGLNNCDYNILTNEENITTIKGHAKSITYNKDFILPESFYQFMEQINEQT